MHLSAEPDASSAGEAMTAFMGYRSPASYRSHHRGTWSDGMRDHPPPGSDKIFVLVSTKAYRVRRCCVDFQDM